MPSFVPFCPACSAELVATRLSCTGCGTQLEGQFELPALLRLPPEDVAFVTQFVKSSGSLKAVAAERGVSYPTVRNRLDEILRRLDTLEQTRQSERRKHEVLDALERGEISVAAAVEKLRSEGKKR